MIFLIRKACNVKYYGCYYCDNIECNQKLFSEGLDGFTGWYSRKTYRLEDLVITIAISTSCEACSRICRYMGIDISENTIIRLIKKHVERDDWAYKKGQPYGTLICDGKTHQPVELLDGHDGSELKKWLLNNKHIKMVTQGRASAYAKAISEVLPYAMQIADRFHLHQNLLKAVKDALAREIPSKITISDENVDSKIHIESQQLKDRKKELTDSEKRRREDIILI